MAVKGEYDISVSVVNKVRMLGRKQVTMYICSLSIVCGDLELLLIVGGVASAWEWVVASAWLGRLSYPPITRSP